MEEARFTRIALDLRGDLQAIQDQTLQGNVHFYNAFFNGTEVVVLGHTFRAADGHDYTEPICIAVDPEVMKNLRVDDESGRVEGGVLGPGKVI